MNDRINAKHVHIHIDGSGSEEELRKEAARVLAEVLDDWEPESSMELTKMTGGMTNTCYKCQRLSAHDNSPVGESVLLRVYGQGTENFFDRAREIDVFQHMAALGVAPPLIAELGNGRLEGFLDHARTFTPPDLADAAMLQRVAGSMAMLHVACSGAVGRDGSSSELMTRLSTWVDSCIAHQAHTQAHTQGLSLTALKAEVEWLADRAEARGGEAVTVHGDLQYGNIMAEEGGSGRAAGGTLYLIDYEYTLRGPPAYDVAGVFNEWACDYTTATPELCDYAKLDREKDRYQQLRLGFCEAYLTSCAALRGASPSTAGAPAVTQEAIWTLLREAEVLSMHNHLHWGLWGLMQSQQSTIEDFDFFLYAQQRIRRYHVEKDRYLEAQALQAPPCTAALQPCIDDGVDRHIAAN